MFANMSYVITIVLFWASIQNKLTIAADYKVFTTVLQCFSISINLVSGCEMLMQREFIFTSTFIGTN